MNMTPYNEAVTERCDAEVRLASALEVHTKTLLEVKESLTIEDPDECWDAMVVSNIELEDAKQEVYSALEWYGEIMYAINIGGV